MPVRLHEPSQAEVLTLREAAAAAGCSVSLVRKLVKLGDVPAREEKTTRGFRYVIGAETLPVLAHKASMRRTGRGEALTGRVLPSREEDSRTLTGGLTETARLRAELAAAEARIRDLQEDKARLWEANTRLTEAVTRLALPAHEDTDGPNQPAKRTFWQWFTGRG